MSTGLVLNERLMIRDRLQEAFRRIIFITDNDFAQDAIYKKANKLLYARIKKLEDYLDVDRPRSVRDVIPNSNLAKYGLYEYNEAREMSYTAGVGCVSLHYPCIYKSNIIKEPWMLPEVEQIFMHTIFTSSYNFKLYEAELEQLEKLDLLEDTTPGSVPTCCAEDFHQVYPQTDPSFERTPGKSFCVYEMQEEANKLPAPFYFTVNNYEEAILKKRILSDVVKELWTKPKVETRQKLFKVYKSSLDNVFVEEANDFRHLNAMKSIDSERTLQSLVKSVMELVDSVPKQQMDKEVIVEETVSQPARRLYSDVVQGNKSSTSNQPEASSPLLQPLSIEDFLLTHRTNSSQISLNNSPIDLRSPEKSESIQETSTTTIELEESSCGKDYKHVNVSSCAQDRSQSIKIPQTSQVKHSYSDAVNNVSGFPSNQNVFLNEYPVYENNFRSSWNTNFQNFFSPLPYVPNTACAGNYRLGYQNTFTGTLTNQSMQTNRQNITSCQQQQWVYPTYRTPNVCNYGTFLGHLLLPQAPTKQRWNNPQYGRPPTPQNVYPPVNQNWGVPNVYRSNSTQQMPGYHPTHDIPKVKPKKASSNPGTGRFVMSKTPDHGTASKNKLVYPKKLPTSPNTTTPTSPLKILSKANSDCKVLSKHDDDIRHISTSPRRNAESDSNIPVSCSLSDDLEKIALREYQSSSDLFFTEIERQAQEQYDGNPENLCCPPNKNLCLGGLSVLTRALLYIRTISTPHISLLKLKRYYLHMLMFTV